jgi:hypothetical protein
MFRAALRSAFSVCPHWTRLKRLLLLDKMGLIELRPGNRVRSKVARDFDWLPDGPIGHFFRIEGRRISSARRSTAAANRYSSCRECSAIRHACKLKGSYAASEPDSPRCTTNPCRRPWTRNSESPCCLPCATGSRTASAGCAEPRDRDHGRAAKLSAIVLARSNTASSGMPTAPSSAASRLAITSPLTGGTTRHTCPSSLSMSGTTFRQLGSSRLEAGGSDVKDRLVDDRRNDP